MDEWMNDWISTTVTIPWIFISPIDIHTVWLGCVFLWLMIKLFDQVWLVNQLKNYKMFSATSIKIWLLHKHDLIIINFNFYDAPG